MRVICASLSSDQLLVARLPWVDADLILIEVLVETLLRQGLLNLLLGDPITVYVDLWRLANHRRILHANLMIARVAHSIDPGVLRVHVHPVVVVGWMDDGRVLAKEPATVVQVLQSVESLGSTDAVPSRRLWLVHSLQIRVLHDQVVD